MTNDKIYQMPLVSAMKTIPAKKLVALVHNKWFAAALLKACQKQQ